MKLHRLTIGIKAVIVALLSAAFSATGFADTSISVLMSQDLPPYQSTLDGFRQHLLDNGVEANFTIMQADGGRGTASRLAGEMNRQDAELIYCLGALACSAIHDLHQERPVIASLVMTPDAINVNRLSTGVFLSFSARTQLQWLKKLFPTLQRIGVIYTPEQNQALIDEAQAVAGQLGLQLIASPIETPKELPLTLKYLLREIDILWALPDRTAIAPQTAREVLLTSFRQRIPVIGPSASWAKGGALYALDWDYGDIGAQNAAMAMKVLNGVPISEIPAAQPRNVSYTLNRKTADYMKLEVLEATSQGAKTVYQK